MAKHHDENEKKSEAIKNNNNEDVIKNKLCTVVPCATKHA